MKTSVVIDSNVWNLLFHNKIDLNVALPREEFSLFITREVEVEVDAIPNEGKDGTDKRPLKKYIQDSLIANQIKTISTFGFAEANTPGCPAIYVGFVQGTFQSNQDRSWYAEEATISYLQGKPKRGSGLTANQTDTAIAACSFHAILLTCDEKPGPITEAARLGGKVIFLTPDLLETKSLQNILRTAQENQKNHYSG